jgi:hypothetical protein
MKLVVRLWLLCLSGTALAQLPTEPLGPCSRRTPFAISEIMYKPAPRTDGWNGEYIEIYNSNPWPETIANYRLGGDIKYTFPPGASVPAQGFLLVAAVPSDVQAIYGITNVIGPYTSSLKTSSVIKLYDEQNSLVLDIDYKDTHPWPMGADGTGHSIVLARPSYGEADPRAWLRSSARGGFPGKIKTFPTNNFFNLCINEVLAHTDAPQTDTIELYNHGTNSVNLAGCTLSDSPTTNKYTIPASTIIPARGFRYFTEAQLGFSLSAAGETIYLKSNGVVVLDALKFEAQENGVSFGRSPDGAADWYRLSQNTFGTNNAPPLVSLVGFNEIMYHPLSGIDDAQYIELYNHGTKAQDLSGWKLGGGISFTFPSNQVLAPNGYLVIARNTVFLYSNYPNLGPANTVGNFSGKLSGSGERITLSMPDTTVGTNSTGGLVTNYLDIVVDEVTYGTGGHWGQWSDGGGSSLELIDPRANKRLPSNWADSDDSAKSVWSTIEATGTLDNGGLNGGGISFAQLGLLDAGECLVDDIEVHPGTNGNNYAANPGFDASLTSWSLLGDHCRSTLETNADNPCLHLRTADSIAVGPNGTQVNLNNNLTAGQVATLRFKAKWLHGTPEPLLRVRGNYLEATGRLPVPSNLGTPGLRNSQAVTNAGPAIYQVMHTPALPTNNQPVVITARVSDPDTIASVKVLYRLDPDQTVYIANMNDFGTNGDAVAKDGLYSVTLAGRATNNITAFAVVATDSTGVTNRFPEILSDQTPLRECLIRFGAPVTTNLFGVYNLWISQGNVTRWTTLPIMSNEDIDGTLVYNNRIIYNMGARYSGSPWHQYYSGPAGSSACHYVWGMPKDDLLLGTASFNKIHWPGNDIQHDTANSNVDDATLQREQTANTFLRALGAPWMNRRYVAVFVNGSRRGNLMEDACRPSAGVAREEYFYDDTDGNYFKLEPWYEFPTNSYGSFTRISWCVLARYTNLDGSFKPARYRSNFGILQTPTTYSDFTNIYTLINAGTASSATSYYADVMENLVDMENWMRVSAANHAAGNWDCFGSSQSGQNADAWISPQHRWKLFTIDFSICLGNGNSLAYGSGIFNFMDPVWQKLIAIPKYKRMYCRALKELTDGPMTAGVVATLMTNKYNAFKAAGLTATSPSSVQSWIASARSSILSQLSSLNVSDFTLSATDISTDTGTVQLSGSAPLSITTITVNGVSYTPTWSSTTAWTLTFPCAFGTTALSVAAYDRSGNQAGSTLSLNVTSTYQPESPVGNVVFSEIMYHPALASGEYVELYNRSTATTFDLSGWSINGLDYTFPQGTVLKPLKYLVLAKSKVVFTTAYGTQTPVYDQFTGSLQNNGETLSLIQPGSPEIIVDRVRYESVPPWPTQPASQPGIALQLIDPAQDNSRVANWAIGRTNSPAQALFTPGQASSMAATLTDFPTLWLNEAQPRNLTGPIDDFGEHDPWIELYNPGTNAVSLDNFYLSTNYDSLAQWSFPSNLTLAPGQFLIVWTDNQPEQNTGAVLHAGVKLSPGAGSIILSRSLAATNQILDYLNYGEVPDNYSFGDVPDGQPFYRQAMYHATPGGTNNASVPPITVSINEWMAENTSYAKDPGTLKFDDWFELYNPTDTPAELGGYYLTDTLSDPYQYQVPIGYRVPAKGFLVVWADGKSSLNSTNSPELHVPFKLDKGGEAIGLFTPDGVAIDAVTFGAQTANLSEGRYPDGGSLRLFMTAPSLGSANLLPAAAGPPSITSLQAPWGEPLTLTFSASPGHTYRVEYAEDLAALVWRPLDSDHFATSAILTVQDTTSATQRFYRIVMVQ